MGSDIYLIPSTRFVGIMFIDEAQIYVSSGKGGDGMVHFHREKYVSRGGPDGGDGGRGGDVVLKVKPTLNTLYYFRRKKEYVAENGKNGGINNQTGRSAQPLVIPVPPGTIVYDDKDRVIGDLITKDQELVICKGGRGGRGNIHFATSRNQAPRTAEKGEPGEEKYIKLELKLIADIGIVGVPNAGKSSLLASVTNAKPKIADYPFTTLEPNLGVAELDLDTSIVLADIPGLIEGAHQGIGLGDSFLKHIQRTRVLIHLIDGMSEDPVADFSQINSELSLFDPNLAQKPQVVALTKLDIPEVKEKFEEIQKKMLEHGYQVMAISSVTHENVKKILWAAYEKLKEVPIIEQETTLPVYRPEEDRNIFHIEKVEGGWRVSGIAIERAAAMTYWEYDGSIRRFQKIMEVLGVDEALRKEGIENGETVFIDEYELEWLD